MHARTRGETGQGARIAAILEAFDGPGELLGPSELARRTGLAKSTAHRLAHELADAGLLEREAGRMRPGALMLEFGRRMARRGLRDAAVPLMGDLREVTRLGVLLAVLDGQDVVCADSLPAAGAPATPRPGDRRPALATASGRAILAFSPRELSAGAIDAGVTAGVPRALLTQRLTKVRRSGVSLDRRERGQGTVACPVLNEAGHAVAALAVPYRGGPEAADRVTAAVRTAALTLSRLLHTH
ncbi:IclR family transcriptional regulator [Actinocorallia sp. A-T 12471]|uniref:IclR family transcriptional regulator n=1 Tax=Actinocorallia sp. A-T 12471 TaxID=3089813 RepID=UPI0029D1EDF9|nr:helix-turn-helix domain-containing protein [Actinocorallia sp. A-T 12471]MDX6741067.1 helix-turn-helix domain-containing protein [Actinocorallia sp. A-T 12471]